MSEAAIITLSKHEDIVSRFEEYCDVKDKTMKGYMVCIRAFGNWIYDNGIMNPTRKDIRNYVRYLDSSKLKPGTRIQYLRAIKQLYKWANVEFGYEDITAGVKSIWKQDKKHHKKDPLSRTDAQTVKESIDTSTFEGKRLYAMFLLCVICGLRDVELSRANIGDIKTLGGRTYLYVWGKGHDEPDAPVWLVPEVLDAITDYLNNIPYDPDPKSPLFANTSRNGKGKHIAASTISKFLKQLLKDAGYNSDRITAHSLRHTSGTAVYDATHNIYMAQQHLRHVNPETTEVYVHSNERQTQNTERLVYDYLFKDDTGDDTRKEAIEIINTMPEDKLKKALDILRALA